MSSSGPAATLDHALRRRSSFPLDFFSKRHPSPSSPIQPLGSFASYRIYPSHTRFIPLPNPLFSPSILRSSPAPKARSPLSPSSSSPYLPVLKPLFVMLFLKLIAAFLPDPISGRAPSFASPRRTNRHQSVCLFRSRVFCRRMGPARRRSYRPRASIRHRSRSQTV